MARPAADLAEALTPQEQYARELDKLLGHVDRLEEQAVRRVIELLAEARRRIITTLADVPDDAFLASYLPRLQAEVESVMAQYVERYSTFFEGEMSRFWDLGIESVDQPMAAVRINLTVNLPALEPRYLDILQGYRAGLITNVAEQAITRITTELQLGVLGGKTPFQIQRAVGEILRTQADAAGRFGTVATRAEMITRTELNRTFNLATASRQEQFQTRVEQVFPDVKPRKQWVTAGDNRVRPSHRRMNGKTVPVDEDFTVVGADGKSYKAKQPHDPRLPASESVACRCRSVISFDSISALLEA